MHQRIASFAGLALLVGLAYAYTWYWLYVRWSAPESFFAHGFLVPLIFLWLLYRRREALEATEKRPDYSGLLLVIPALLMHCTAVYLEVYSPSGFTLPILLGGMVVYFYGWKVLRCLLFPILYLYFAIPLPMNWVQEASFNLKITAVRLSIGLAGFLGVAVVDMGSSIHFSNGDTLLVGSPCSGLRSLVALVAVGVLFAFEFAPLSFLGRLLFVVLTVPIAVFSNILRITFLCLVAHQWGADAVSGTVHDVSGYAIYLVAFLFMLGLNRLLAVLPCFRGRAPCESHT